MMEQYKKETAQIHAPAALIEMTKAAVREEENRIRREIGQVSLSAPKVTYEDYAAYHRKRSLHRWIYPVTAAAAVVILVSVSMAMRGVVWSGDYTSGAAEADMDMMTTAEMAVEEEDFVEMPAEINDGAENSAAALEKMENVESAAMDNVVLPETAEGTGGAMADASVEDFAVEDAQDEKEQKDGMRRSAKAKRKDGSVQIEAVEEKPDFYNDSDAEDIVYEDRTFRIMKEEGGWAAYVEIHEGEAYVIHGQIEDQRTFLQEAYASLTEKTE